MHQYAFDGVFPYQFLIFRMLQERFHEILLLTYCKFIYKFFQLEFQLIY